MRLDKLLADSGYGTRSEVRKVIVRGNVTVGGVVVRDPGFKISEKDEVTCFGDRVTVLSGKTYYYLLLDKPDGVLTAMEDSRLPHVGEFIDSRFKNRGVSPVGRLDYHTTGLLILTNDGELSHRLTSPNYDIPKTYLVTWAGDPLTDKEIARAEEGITLTDTDTPVHLKPCRISPCGENSAKIILTEGKTHEVRRIMAHFGKEVIDLRRLGIASLFLSEDSAPGTLRELTSDEISILRSAVRLE